MCIRDRYQRRVHGSLIREMLATDPQKRPSINEILKNPYFKCLSPELSSINLAGQPWSESPVKKCYNSEKDLLEKQASVRQLHFQKCLEDYRYPSRKIELEIAAS
eukprot:TRINITY_DN45443_c0_g1_i1.p2 TRINITY_DN45443_c0_g1~~TRINITY_DN45443_c0_g1_i1.p2  ORF type:complete len:105 (+),score=25.11 TRINITY_DN45443_c0_g1_i1:171-485(+)